MPKIATFDEDSHYYGRWGSALNVRQWFDRDMDDALPLSSVNFGIFDLALVRGFFDSGSGPIFVLFSEELVGMAVQASADDWFGTAEAPTKTVALPRSGTDTFTFSESGSINGSYGLVAYWRLDETSGTTVVDSSGTSSPATINGGVTFPVVGKVGTAFSFDGISGTFIDNGAPIPAQQFSEFGSVAAWIKTANAGAGERGIVAQAGGWHLLLLDNVFVIWDYQTGYQSTSVNVADNNWHHLCVTFAIDHTNGCKLYIDGLLVLTTAQYNTDISWHIVIGTGSHVDGSNHDGNFAGIIDDVRIYNRVLTGAEVALLYAPLPTPNVALPRSAEDFYTVNEFSGGLITSGLVGNWRFDEKTGDTTALDSSGTSSPATINGAVTLGVAGKVGNAFSFAGTNGNVVNCGSDPALELLVGSLAAWIKTANAGAGRRDIIAKATGYHITLVDNVFQVYDNLVGFHSTGVNVADNTWHHLCITFNSPGNVGVTNGTILYIDGLPVLTTTQSIGDASLPTVIGAGNSVGDFAYYAGLIDDARVYNRLITPAEVWELYTQGVGARAAAHPRSVSDSVSFSETLTRGALALARTARDGSNVGIFDAAVPYGLFHSYILVPNAWFSTDFMGDSVLFSDLGTGKVALSRSATDSLSLSESTQRDEGRSLSDSVSFSDSATRAVALPRSVTDSLSFSETLDRLVAFARSLSDSSAFSDTATENVGVSRTASDTFSLSETLDRIVALPRSAREGSNAGIFDGIFDAATRYGLFHSYALFGPAWFSSDLMGDSTLFSESVDRAAALQGVASDSLPFSDSADPIVALHVTATDSLSFSETLDRLVAFARSVRDSSNMGIFDEQLAPFGFFDNYVLVPNAWFSTDFIGDSAIFSDSASRALALPRSVSDTFSFSETLTKLAAFARSLSDSLSFSESTQRNEGRSVSDSVSFSDSASRLVAVVRSLTDTATFSETLARIASHPRTATDTLAFSETLDRVAAFARAVSDVLSFSDSASATASAGTGSHYHLTATDTFIFSDAVDRLVSTARALSDSVAFSDSAARAVALPRSVSDTVLFTDTVERLIALTRGAADNFTFSDTASRAVALARQLIDTFNLSESIARGEGRSAEDNFAFSDEVTRALAVHGLAQDDFVMIDRAYSGLLAWIHSQDIGPQEGINVNDPQTPQAGESIAGARLPQENAPDVERPKDPQNQTSASGGRLPQTNSPDISKPRDQQ